MKKSYQELVLSIRDAVREKAQEIPIFKKNGNGAIRITARPSTVEADRWLGGFSGFEEADGGYQNLVDVAFYEHVYTIAPEGSCVIEVEDEYGACYPTRVDCYAYSALKIAHCSLAKKLGTGMISGLNLNDIRLREENGYAPRYGALSVSISTPAPWFKDERQQFCSIYVSVSGASQEEDITCAFAAVNVIENFFKNEGSYFLKDEQYKVVAPEFPEFKKSPLDI